MKRKENDELIAKVTKKKKEEEGEEKGREGKEREGWKVKSTDRYLGIEIDGNGMKRRSERKNVS